MNLLAAVRVEPAETSPSAFAHDADVQLTDLQMLGVGVLIVFAVGVVLLLQRLAHCLDPATAADFSREHRASLALLVEELGTAAPPDFSITLGNGDIPLAIWDRRGWYYIVLTGPARFPMELLGPLTDERELRRVWRRFVGSAAGTRACGASVSSQRCRRWFRTGVGHEPQARAERGHHG
jgi:hypothetical protein